MKLQLKRMIIQEDMITDIKDHVMNNKFKYLAGAGVATGFAAQQGYLGDAAQQHAQNSLDNVRNAIGAPQHQSPQVDTPQTEINDAVNQATNI